MTNPIRLPDDTQHVAIAGRTGSGKTVAALELLLMRDMRKMAWIIIDHKKDDNIAKLPAHDLNINSLFLPTHGLHRVQPRFNAEGREELENFLLRAFNRGRIGIHVDEGHLVGKSDAIRSILVAGRSKHVPLVWTSQRAAWIDTFIWSQASFYRVFALQTKHDIKRFEENVPVRWKTPEEFHSFYYDVGLGKVYYLKPSAAIDETVKRLDVTLRTQYHAV